MQSSCPADQLCYTVTASKLCVFLKACVLAFLCAQGIQQQLDRALQENAQLKELNKSTEGSLNDISGTAHR